jgi:hypothetical protein
MACGPRKRSWLAIAAQKTRERWSVVYEDFVTTTWPVIKHDNDCVVTELNATVFPVLSCFHQLRIALWQFMSAFERVLVLLRHAR